MLAINNLSIYYGKKDLFKNVSAQMNEQERVGLVGVNGAGKSTLLKILTREIETDFGVVQRPKSATIGYLPQETAFISSKRTLYEEAESAFSFLLVKQKKLEDINSQLSIVDPTSKEYSTLLKQQGDLQQELDHADLFRIGAQIEKILSGLGFTEKDFDQPCRNFSGGWLMRLMLAKLLLVQPTLLLLDEPTNHLDIESLIWLEKFLHSYQKGMIIISHDRSFLDNLTTATWELRLGKLTIYKGNYSKYVEEKGQRMEIQRASYENQQAHIRQTKRFVQRFRAKSTKAKQVQSRLKALSKMVPIELDDVDKKVSFQFPPAPRSGRQALTLEGITKCYEDKTVFKDITFSLQRGDKLAVIGVNGAGKSTLICLLAGILAADGGNISYGHNIRLSYFGQHQAQRLSPDLTVLETLAGVEGERTITQDRTLLAAFLFKGDDVYKKVNVLSGGEKSRLALAKMIATPANLLLMDEPTNHLDMTSQEILQEAMSDFNGTIVVASHNRHFLDQFINKVLVIKEGTATLYHGNLGDYLEKKKADGDQENSQSRGTTSVEVRVDRPALGHRKKLRQLQAQLRREKSTKLSPHKDTVQESEKRIEILESRKSALEALMADHDTYQDSDRFSELSKEYKDIERRLDRYYLNWEEAQSAIENIEAHFLSEMAKLGEPSG